MRETPLPPGFRRATDPVPDEDSKVEQLALLPGVTRSDLDQLKDGASLMTQAGNRVAALALLWSAIAIDPIDLGAHRRLAATLAAGGDIDAAAEEYERYIEFLLPLGEIGRATLELQYGASTLGGRPALAIAADKIVEAVRAILPAAGAPPTRATLELAAMPEMAATPRAAFVAATTEPAAFVAPRLLPKVPFRFCLHQDGERHWMQLEGGSSALVPDAVRIVDSNENVIETRTCILLEPGDSGHARVVDDFPPAVAWVVIGVSNDVVAAYDAGAPAGLTLQAKVGHDWLSLDLIDTGCRLGRTHSDTAAS